ncbi:MAG: hypothetical protein DRJ26_01490 [Candidatus Methanomethylicota archaeon]|uniref:Adenine DNA glycosylase n=1 Tax=Thermoproteota archaeon TaxID=2056631 RepID=A0A497F5F0_9CREN|nr:MAG: hypothetical protein DRJ26_01490 [Candidatus Verstraetearchaeota archaeon]
MREDGKYAFFKNQIENWWKTNKRIFPWRKRQSAWNLLVTAILLRKTNADKVARHYNQILGKLNSPISTYNLKLSKIEDALKPLGLHKSRARQLKEASKIILEKYGGKIPDKLEELLKIPGVGMYTASVILGMAYGKNIPIVDINVVRVMSRFFGLSKLTLEKASEMLMKMVGKDDATKISLAIIDFSAKICKARKPKCENCPLTSRCKFSSATKNF